MKRTLSLMLCVLLVGFAFGQTATPPAAGDGSAGNPYQIASLENLYWLQVAGFPGYSIQTADIDASPTSTWFSDGSGGYYGWPAGTCSGNYDGQGFIIDGLYVNRSSTNYCSLFGNATGPITVGSRNTITDVHLTNMDITGSQDVGGIVGLASKYDINDCSAQGSVEGVTYVGGIAGRVRGEFGTTVYLDGNISLATVTGWQNTGCFTGALVKSQITNCYAKGNTIGLMNSSNGGLIGDITETTMLYCYSAGPVSNGGGLIGSSDSGEEGSSTVMFCYWDYQTSGQASSAEGEMKTTVQMTTQSTYASWDFTDTWSIESTSNDGYPYLQANLPENALPIMLVGFEANVINGNVRLSWNTESETDNAKFLIYRNDEIIAAIDGAGTSTEPHNYSYTDTQVLPGKSYTYVLADISLSNELVVHNDHALTIMIDEEVISEGFALGTNYPNPFNPSTTIPFDVVNESHINLSIYNIHGQLVRQLINENYVSGAYTAVWDGRNNEGKDLQSGLYVYLMTSNNSTQSGKMLLVK